MESIFVLILFLVAVAIVCAVASKRGLSGWTYGICTVVLGAVFLIIIGRVGGPVAGGFGMFIAPALSLFLAFLEDTDEAMAVSKGESNDHKKCPFCAEAVRKEALKCKHCGSELTVVA